MLFRSGAQRLGPGEPRGERVGEQLRDRREVRLVIRRERERVGAGRDGELEAAVLDTIRHHERAHLVDSFHYLPFEANLWRGLGLLFSFGFSPAAIEGEMERRAELASLALSPHTHLVLAHIAEFQDQYDPASPHGRGFRALARELVERLRARGVPEERLRTCAWHELDPGVVREVAREMLATLPYR